ncbi:MAG: hypothetical protein WDN04_03310 [Rhodospirillales bacterium]
MLQDFAGKTALITGAATGIGRALGLAPRPPRHEHRSGLHQRPPP